MGWLSSDQADMLRSANEATEEPAPPPPAVPPPPAAAWVAAQEIALSAALEAVSGGILADGYHIGAQAAQAVIEGVDVDWGTWTPGDPDAAAKVLDGGSGAGLQRILDDAPVQIIGELSDARLRQLARVLARAVARGDTSAALARELLAFRDDPLWARLAAHTLIAGAISAATMDQYVEHDIEQHEWLVAGLDPKDRVRVCGLCAANGADGPIPVGDLFSSGALYPPQHPRCRCALMPWIDIPQEAIPAWLETLTEQLMPAPAHLGETAPGGQHLKRYWISGEGAARWSTWRQLYKHLRKHLPADYAKRVTSQWFHDRFGYWPGAKRHDRAD